MKKPILIAVIVALMAPMLSSPKAYAVSDFDNAYRNTNNFTAVNPFQNPSNWLGPKEVSQEYINAMKIGEFPLPTDELAYFNTAINSGSYGVSIVTFENTSPNNDLENRILFFYTTDNTQTVKFDYWSSNDANLNPDVIATNPTQWHMTTLALRTDSNGQTVLAPFTTTNADQPFSTYSYDMYFHRYYNLYIHATIDYPTGYEGRQIPSSYTAPTQTEVVHPTFSYKVTGLNIQLHSTVDLAGVSNCHWRIDENPAEEDDAGPLQESNTTECPDFSYTWEKVGTYFVHMVVTKDGQTTIGSTRLTIDGSSFSGIGNDTGGTVDSMYETCSGTDIPCNLRNFAKWVFIPDMSTLSGIFANMKTTLTNHLGFLWYPFDWLISLFQQAGQASNSCTINTSAVPGSNINATFFGAQVNINPCGAEQTMPQIYNIVVFFVRVTTVFALIFALYRRMEYVLIERRLSR